MPAWMKNAMSMGRVDDPAEPDGALEGGSAPPPLAPRSPQGWKRWARAMGPPELVGKRPGLGLVDARGRRRGRDSLSRRARTESNTTS